MGASLLALAKSIYYFLYITSGVKQYFTILTYKLHSFNIQDDQSTRGLLAKPLK